MTVRNNPVIGDSKDNKLTNDYTSGYTYMSGSYGNDTYVVNNITNTFTDVDDLQLFDDGGYNDDGDFYFNTRGGDDTLVIKNRKGTDLAFLFDVVKNGVNEEIGDGLDIVEKNNIGAYIAQARLYYYDNILPQTGIISISGYFGNILYGGNYWGSNRIETIKTSTSNGVTYTYDLDSYIYSVTAKVKSFLNTVKYTSAYSVLYYGDDYTLNLLSSIYTNTPIKMKIRGSNKSDNIYGGNAYDNINGKSGNDKIYGYGGNDVIRGDYGKDTIDGGAGNDKLYGQAGNDNLYGKTGNDQIWGDSGNDKIYGGYGNDTIKGYSGKDTIDGGSGDDKLYGQSGNDKLYGKSGKDTIYGGKGNDTINAGTGKNRIYFAKNDGNDTIISGGGTDTIIFTNEKFKNIKIKISGDDVFIKYTGGQIKLKNYNDGGHSARYIKIGNEQKSIDDLVYEEKMKMYYPFGIKINTIKSDVAGWISSGTKGYSNDTNIYNDTNVQDTILAAVNNSNFINQEL